jgi:hypothetical protein
MNGETVSEQSASQRDSSHRPVEESRPLRITMDDVTEANQLSLGCPICASPVERNAQADGQAPVICTECGTLYHRACWEANGGVCAVLGCSCNSYRPYGEAMGPVLTIRRSDLDRVPPGYRNQQLKRAEKRGTRPRQPQKPSFWRTLFRRIIDALGG